MRLEVFITVVGIKLISPDNTSSPISTSLANLKKTNCHVSELSLINHFLKEIITFLPLTSIKKIIQYYTHMGTNLSLLHFLV